VYRESKESRTNPWKTMIFKHVRKEDNSMKKTHKELHEKLEKNTRREAIRKKILSSEVSKDKI
jgi:hypothetical protein